MSVKKLMTFINRIVPKKNIILFDSYPDYSDNSRSLYEYIVKNRPDIMSDYLLVWGVNDYESARLKVKPNTEVVRKKSVRGLMCFFRASYIFTTHGYFSDVYSGGGQKQINLWHGCGYKKMPEEDRMYRGDITIAPGNPYKTIQAKEFDLREEDVLITGLPRNDELFKREQADLSDIEINRSDYSKIIIWMPTYRKAKIGHHGVDGDVGSFGASTISPEGYDKLNRVLKDTNILLLIKPHPMESAEIDLSKGYSNIKIISNQMLSECNLSLYGLLGQTDGLLSDYSSVVIDYLLLNKPIAMTISDMNEYRNSRGFLFDRLEDFLPGPIIADEKELADYFVNIDAIEEKHLSKRLRLTKYFHRYPDGNSSERVAKEIFGEERGN